MFIKNILRNSSFFQNLLSFFIKGHDGCVVLTFHNIKVSEFGWFKNLIENLNKDYLFIDPKNFSTSSNVNKKQILLTFDDGFKNHKVIVENILNPLGIKALFFVPVNFIGLNEKEAKTFCKISFFPNSVFEDNSPHDWSAMNWDDIYFLIQHGHTIGGHTFSHPILSEMNPNDVENEIVNSAKLLGEKINSPILFFAYPFGSTYAINNFSIGVVKSYFKYAFVNIRGFVSESQSDHVILRQNIFPGMKHKEVINIIKGRYNPIFKNYV